MPKIIFSVTDEQKALYVECAYSERVSLSEWVRRAADARLSPLELRPDDRHEQAEAAAWAEDEANRSSAPSSRALTEHKADPRDKASQEHAPKEKRKSAGGMCEHRVPIGSYCKRCEEAE